MKMTGGLKNVPRLDWSKREIYCHSTEKKKNNEERLYLIETKSSD